MTNDEIKAAARETVAYLLGFAYGCEQTIRAHDDLVSIVARGINHRPTEERVAEVMAEVDRVQKEGGVESLDLFDLERALHGGSSDDGS